MTDNKRLEALREKAEGMPTGYLDEKHIFHDGPHNPCISGENWKLIFDGSGTVADKEPSGLDVAESLLAALDKDAPVVKIRHVDIDSRALGGTITMCQGRCDLYNRCGYREGAVPGPDCPAIKMPLGEDEEYILVRRKVVR